MKLSNLMLLPLASWCLFSCSNDEIINNQSVNNENVPSLSRTQENLLTTFIYHGKTYESYYRIENDSIIVYENEDVQTLAKQFDETPELVSFIYPNGIVEYFDTHEEFMESLNRLKNAISTINQEVENVTTYGLPALKPADCKNNDAELYLYDDINYEDTKGTIVLKRGTSKIEIPHLKHNFSPNMNDKTSSLQAFSIAGTTLFELFEDDNYRSHCMSFLVNNSQRTNFGNQEFSLLSDDLYPKPDDPRSHWGMCTDENLKDNHVVGTVNSKWNDRITSVRITRQ